MAIFEQEHRSLAGVVLEVWDSSSIVIEGEYGRVGPESLHTPAVGDFSPGWLVLGIPGTRIYRLANLSGIGKPFRKILEDVLRVFLAVLENLGELLSIRSFGFLGEAFPDRLVKKGVYLIVKLQEESGCSIGVDGFV